MALPADTVLIKTYDLWKELFPVISKFPKSYKFNLGERIQNISSELMEMLTEAYYSRTEAKKELLHKANIKVEILRRYLRLSYELGMYNSTAYGRLSGNLDEIGRIIGGWIKSIKQ